MTSTRDRRIATIPEELRSQLQSLPDDMILAVHDLMHVEMERRHGRKEA